MVTGRLAAKMPRHPTVATIVAASAGPATPMTPHTAEMAAKARGRRRAGTDTPTPAMAAVITAPANTPWTARAASRVCIDGATVTSNEVAAKPTAVMRKVRRTPRPSTAGPAARTATAAVNSSTVITHGRSSIWPRSSPTSGRAAETERLL